MKFIVTAFNRPTQLYGGPIDYLFVLMRLLSLVSVEIHTV